ncbi:hypothetical protein R6Q57_002804 [Mikania cordata]
MANHSTGKKSTIIWTKGLRKKFVEAVGKLGIDNAAPKKIVELMDVEGLTRDHVSSYLQKYRILLKKISNGDKGVQAASKPSLLESSVVNDTSSLMLNQEQMNSPSYSEMHTTNPLINPSRSTLSFLEDSNFDAAMSCDLIHTGLMPNEGTRYSMQAMPNNLDEQRNLIYDTTSMGFVNQNFVNDHGFVPNLDGFDYGVYPYKNSEMGSSNGVNMTKELPMRWNQENPINIGNFSNSVFDDNFDGFVSKYSGQSQFVEMGSLYGSNSNGYNMKNGTGEDDLVMTEADIASLLFFADDNGDFRCTSNDIAVAQDPQNQDVNGKNSQDIVSFDSNKNVETPSINQQHTLDGYLHGSDPPFT